MLGGFFHSPEVQFNNLTNELQGKNHRYTHTSPYSDQEFSLDPKFRLSLGTGCQELIWMNSQIPIPEMFHIHTFSDDLQ